MQLLKSENWSSKRTNKGVIFLTSLFDYVIEDRTWIHLDAETFKRELGAYKDNNRESEDIQSCKIATGTTILATWGDNAMEPLNLAAK